MFQRITTSTTSSTQRAATHSRSRRLLFALGIAAIATFATFGGAHRSAEAASTGTIIDAKVITGNSSNISCGGGWTKKGTDLNGGAGGKYVYLCVQFGSISASGITKLYAVKGNCDSGDQRIDGNLNDGTKHGKAIYFCKSYKSNIAGGKEIALGSVEFMVYGNGTPNWLAISTAHTGCGAMGGYLPNEQDLNEGAGGKWIYICNIM